MRFCIIGLGFIAPRHIKAIEDIGGEIDLVCDIEKKDAKALGLYRFDNPLWKKIRYFTDWKVMMDSWRFNYIDCVVILTPNYLHYPMIVEARKRGKRVICEKPLVIQLDKLSALVNDEDIYTTLQLRYGYPILEKRSNPSFNEIRMNIEVHRGEWYYKSWKVDREKSGGLLFNIGIHYFDLLLSRFPGLKITEISKYNDKRMEGMLESESARISWRLRIDTPENEQKREIKFAGREPIDLTGFSYGSGHGKTEENFGNLHTNVYKDIMKGEGIRPKDLVKVTRLVQEMTERSSQ